MSGSYAWADRRPSRASDAHVRPESPAASTFVSSPIKDSDFILQMSAEMVPFELQVIRPALSVRLHRALARSRSQRPRRVRVVREDARMHCAAREPPTSWNTPQSRRPIQRSACGIHACCQSANVWTSRRTSTSSELSKTCESQSQWPTTTRRPAAARAPPSARGPPRQADIRADSASTRGRYSRRRTVTTRPVLRGPARCAGPPPMPPKRRRARQSRRPPRSAGCWPGMPFREKAEILPAATSEIGDDASEQVAGKTDERCAMRGAVRRLCHVGLGAG